jgi:DUF971 family protein
VQTPRNIQLIGQEIAIAWSEGTETYFPVDKLRAASPSAEQRGERDILGQLHGGSDRTSFAGVEVTGWEQVGNYAIRFDFSDGHRSGLYSYEYLLDLAKRLGS